MHFLQLNFTFIDNRFKMIHKIIIIILNYTKFAFFIYCKEIYIYTKKTKLILKNVNDNFMKLCNEFHIETPLIVMKNQILLVLANITEYYIFFA